MSINRAPKSGFAAEAQRKVSTKLFIFLLCDFPGTFVFHFNTFFRFTALTQFLYQIFLKIRLKTGYSVEKKFLCTPAEFAV